MVFSGWPLFAGKFECYLKFLNWLVMLLMLRFIKLFDSFTNIGNLACICLSFDNEKTLFSRHSALFCSFC